MISGFSYTGPEDAFSSRSVVWLCVMHVTRVYGHWTTSSGDKPKWLDAEWSHTQASNLYNYKQYSFIESKGIL